MFKLFESKKSKKEKAIVIIYSLFLVILLLIIFYIFSRKILKPSETITNSNIEVYESLTKTNTKENLPLINNLTKLKTDTLAQQSTRLNGFSETVPILMYHYIGIAPASSTLKGLYLDPKIFEGQLQELKNNNYSSLFISDVASSINSKNKLSNNNIVLTFDDGYEDFYTKVYPLLVKYNYKATLYVIINALDTPGYLTKTQVKELASSGLVEIGSHTFNHPDLRNLKFKDARFEIEASRQKLEQISGQKVLSFAYPFGLYKPEFFALASSTPYLTAVSVIPGSRQGEENKWILRRIRPDNRSGAIFISWLKDWEMSLY
ncbi:MAG: polysaccharide deacetylase family protein [Patescibacteria group bacterium]